jgi:voltage-dependent calcium channel
MRIYEGDHTVRNILEDCSVNLRDSFQVHSAGRNVHGIDLDKLNNRLNSIPVEDIRKKRARMNVFYEEMMVTADPDRGISFTLCLMTLAHYNVIDDSKSLRLDEFLKRRARQQRVEESIRRNIVRGFFDTLYWSRRFRRIQKSKGNFRMAGPPQLAVPEIFVEDPDDTMTNGKSTEPQDFTESIPGPSPLTMEQGSSSSSFNARGVPRIDTTLRRRDSSKTSPTRGDNSASPSPSLSPSRLFPTDTAYLGPVRATTPTSPRTGHSRQGSAVSSLGAEGVMESFGNSAWGQSIRRSFSMRRPSGS